MPPVSLPGPRSPAIPPSRRRAALAAIAAFALGAGPARSQSPSGRATRIVVPFPPGGPNDIMARLTAQMLQESLGLTVVVDHRGGAGGSIGADLVAKGPADGSLLLFGNPAVLAVNPAIHRRGAGYDPLGEFTPIALLATAPSVLICHPALAAKTLREAVALAKGAPGRLNYASAGIGTTPHLAGELFKSMTGTDIVHVPYKGGGPALTDLVAGQVQFYFAGISAALPFIADGRVRALAVTGTARSAAAPAVPTFAEAGLPGYEVENWYALVAPKGTSAPLVASLHAGLAKGLASPAVKKRLTELAAQPVGGGPAQLAAYVAAEYEKWSRVAREADIRPE